MSTRIHWGDSDGHRSCTHGKTSEHKACTATEFLRLPNLCRTCERVAQKSEALSVLQAFGSGKPKSLPAVQWPEPRPIAEAPKDGTWFLGWTAEDAERYEGWELIKWSTVQCAWVDSELDACHPMQFLSLPPKPEVRK